jgi:hypothetical protein
MDENNNRTVPNSFFQSSAFGQASVLEMSLSFNQPKEEMIKNKLNWNGNIFNNPSYINDDYLTQSNFLDLVNKISAYFTLRPLEIRTFKVELNSKKNLQVDLIHL